MDKRLINIIFKTPIGKVVCGLDSNSLNIKSEKSKIYEHGKSKVFESNDYVIELVEFKIRQPLYNGETIFDTNGWIWRIEKTNGSSCELKLFCELIDFENNLEFDTATGENLDSIEAYNKDWKLHIGTEDGEIMNTRAKLDDWFPNRLKKKVNIYRSITKMNINGFRFVP